MPTLSANTRTPRPRGIAKIAVRNATAAGSWAAAAIERLRLMLVVRVYRWWRARGTQATVARTIRKKR